jgi:hypothetical protein
LIIELNPKEDEWKAKLFFIDVLWLNIVTAQCGRPLGKCLYKRFVYLQVDPHNALGVSADEENLLVYTIID